MTQNLESREVINRDEVKLRHYRVPKGIDGDLEDCPEKELAIPFRAEDGRFDYVEAGAAEVE